jgi:hypothetical protein
MNAETDVLLSVEGAVCKNLHGKSCGGLSNLSRRDLKLKLESDLYVSVTILEIGIHLCIGEEWEAMV